MRYLFMRVSGKVEIALGSLSGPGDVPELLRHVADFYDDNPDACEQLFDTPVASPAALSLPFSGDAYSSS